MAPAEVPEIASISSQSSSSSAVEHAPGEGAVRTAALQREVDRKAGAPTGGVAGIVVVGFCGHVEILSRSERAVAVMAI